MTKRRGRDEGSIYQRESDGRWVGAISLGYDARGKRRRRIVYGSTKREVQQKLLRLRAAIEAGHPQPSGREQTVGAFLERWLASTLKPRVRHSTYRRAEGIVRDYLTPAIGNRPLSRLNAQDVNDLLLDLGKRGLSQRSIQYTRGVLRSALKQAQAWGLVVLNVAELVQGPRVQRSEVAALTPERAQEIIKATANDPIGPLVVVALGTGLRQGEQFATRWRDVSLADATLTVRHSLQRVDRRFELVEPKTAKSRRTVPLPAFVVDTLRSLPARLPVEDDPLSDLVFTDPEGRPLHGTTVTKRFQQLLGEADPPLPRMRWHDLRHGAVSLLLAQGVPLTSISDLLGHAGYAITKDTYGALDDDLKRETADAMDAALRGRS